MKLQDIKNISGANVLSMVGLRRKSSLRTWLGGGGLVGIGMAVGAAIVLLLTPKSGPEVRDSLSEGFRSLRKRAANAAIGLTH
jgi:gas vesicle protein